MATGSYRGLDYYGVDELYSEEELAIRDTVRDFVGKEIVPIIGKHFTAGTFPRELIPVFGQMGLLGASMTRLDCTEQNERTPESPRSSS